MKKLLLFILFIAMMVTPAFALDLGGSESSSHYYATTTNVTTKTDSFDAVGVIGSGSATGSNYAGGQALTTHDYPFSGPLGDVQNGSATQNMGEALGGFDFSISTGNKFFSMAGALGGTKGDVSQGSIDSSSFSLINGGAGSIAGQGSEAGFIGADGALLIGKNKGPVVGSFTGDSVVLGETYSYSYTGQNGATNYIGTVSGAANLADTTITGGFGSGYAGGGGQTAGGSYMASQNGYTSGAYGGRFSYSGNGAGSVAGYSESYNTQLPNGAVVGTHSGISVNVN